MTRPIVIDAACPLAARPAYLDLYRQGGVTACAPTVGGGYLGPADTLTALGQWHRLLAERDDLRLVLSATDIETCAADGKLGLILHFQGVSAIGDQLDRVDAWAALGIRVVQLAYNTRNIAGDGCEEPGNAGLSRFGRDLVRRLNRARLLVDGSHTGRQTVLDAIEVSSAPVVLSHANPKAVHPSLRNVDDDLIRAIAGTGGVIGLVGFPAFVSSQSQSTLDQFIDHACHLAEVAGIDHVGLGIDYFWAQAPLMDDAGAQALYADYVGRGAWSPASYPPPPWHYPAGIETPDKLGALADGLARRGFAGPDVAKIMGLNWLRVYRAVWDG